MELNKIYNMDCLEGMKMIEDKSVTHSFTSPPYNRKRNDKYKNYNDTLKDYKTFLKSVVDELLRVTTDYVFFNIQKNYYNKQEVFELIGEYSNQILDIIIWNKTNPMPASGLSVTNAYEFILVLSDNKTSLKANDTYTKNNFTTSVYSNTEYQKIHKAIMNPDACNHIIKNFTNEGDLILDSFMGLGTTALSCLELNRNFIGFELNEEYYNIATKRIEDEKSQTTIFDYL